MQVTKISIDRKQTVFVEKGNACLVFHGSVEQVAEVVAKYPAAGAVFVFDMAYAKKTWRTACLKRIARIAEAAGVAIGEPVEYFIDGFRQVDKFAVEILGEK